MKARLFSVIISVAIALSLCGCNNDANSSKADSDSSALEFTPNATQPQGEKITSEIISNTFENITDMTIYSDCSNEFFSVIYAKNTLDTPDGIYSSPNVFATVNGKEVNIENVAYIIVSGENINMSVSFNGGFVKSGSEIYVSVENFNTLREPVDENDIVSFDECTDQTVYTGKLEIKATANESFGAFTFDFSDKGAGKLTIGESSASFENALAVLGEKSTTDNITLITKAGTEIKYDQTNDMHISDEDGNVLKDYSAYFSFSDSDKIIDLAEIDDILLNGESLLK